MGAGRWDADSRATYDNFSTSTRGKTTDEVYTERKMNDALNPFGVTIRESRDSAENPNSNAIIVGIDVTGSMGIVADALARQGLGTLFDEILKRKPVADPHLMFMAIGDANCDRAPLQVSQFEADARIIEQLASIYLEKGGGGNSFESYNLPWYFAAVHTSIDCFEKRGKKGYLFTVGDEESPQDLTRDQIKRFLGDTLETNIGNDELLAMVQRMYHVFHVVIEEGSHYRSYPDKVRRSWSARLGQSVLYLADHTKLSEVIVSAIEINEGRNAADVAASWSADTALVVAKATRELAVGA
jgi:hypothetical protein